MSSKKKPSSGPSSSLGKTIIKDKNRSRRAQRHGESWLHSSELGDGYDWNRLDLKSVTEESRLDEFLATAQLAGTEFTAERLNIKVVDPSTHTGLPSPREREEIEHIQQENMHYLSIPRRPSWDASTTPEQLELMERESFLSWRRNLARLQEDDRLIITPFERNIEFWRQLWRVMERSDIIVQIVDARNPLLFRCEDLEKYVKESESQKVNMLLISKADLLTLEQRLAWARYFSQYTDITVAFWSALDEAQRLKNLEDGSHSIPVKSDSHSSLDPPIDMHTKEGQFVPEGGSEEDSEEDESNEDSGDRHTHLVRDMLAESTESQQELKEPESEEQHDTTDHHSDDAADTAGRDLDISDKANDPDATDNLADPESHPDDATRTDAAGRDLDISGVGNDGNRTTHDTTDNLSDTDSLSDPESHPDSDPDATRTNTAGPTDTTGSDLVAVGDNPTRCKVEQAETSVDCELLTREELLELFLAISPVKDGELTTVGMVGYPNVGKSTTINTLFQNKKVPVSQTPGRTKHFQTLYIDDHLMLCDCPGLVFPRFVATKAEMVCSGILPIDQMRDHTPPTSLVCEHIPRSILEDTYGIRLPRPQEGEDPSRPPFAHELLNAYGYMRGFMTSHGIPDCSRSARHILKDYVNGKLLYCHPPPGVDREGFNRSLPDRGGRTQEGSIVSPMAESTTPVSNFDKQYFREVDVSAISKGVYGTKGFVRRAGFTSHQSQTGEAVPDSDTASFVSGSSRAAGKPWKKHYNRKKKEKTRRLVKVQDY